MNPSKMGLANLGSHPRLCGRRPFTQVKRDWSPLPQHSVTATEGQLTTALGTADRSPLAFELLPVCSGHESNMTPQRAVYTRLAGAEEGGGEPTPASCPGGHSKGFVGTPYSRRDGMGQSLPRGQ